MKTMRYILTLAAECLLLTGPAPAHAQVTFEGLGDLPGGSFTSLAYGVSAYGSVVVGQSNSTSGTQAFRWEGGVMTGLGALPGGNPTSQARGVSADGAVVAGFSGSLSNPRAFRWEGGVMTDLSELPGGGFASGAFGVSADGAVVVGFRETASGEEAFRWEGGVMTGLGDLSGGSFLSSGANGVSADGAVVVGVSNSPSGNQAFRWEGGVMTGLGDLPGGGFSSRANGVSADGTVVVGLGSSASGGQAFRWEGGVMIGLGDLPGGQFSSTALGVSADGAVVVGQSNSASGFEAFIWDAVHGMRNLRSFLTNDVGLDLTGWTLVSADAITPNGRAIVGVGTNPDGNTEAYRVLADAAWTLPTGGAWEGVGNWGYWGPPPSADEDASITPANGLTVAGPVAAATMNSLAIGTPGAGFAELRLQPGGSVTTTAGLTIQNRGRLFGSGQVGGPVAIEAGGDVSLLPGDAIVFDSPVTNGGEVNVINATLTFPGDGDPDGDNSDGLTNNTTLNLINAEINGDVHSPSGSTINVGAGVVFNGLVSGAGNFPGAGLVTFNGGYSPGDSPAVIEMNGGVSFGSSNALSIELGGLLSGEFDQLNVAGDAALDGTLVLTLLDDFTPEASDVFTIIDGDGGLTGFFSNAGDGQRLPVGGGSFQVNYLGNDVQLSNFAAVPEPSSLVCLGGLLTLAGLRLLCLPDAPRGKM